MYNNMNMPRGHDAKWNEPRSERGKTKQYKREGGKENMLPFLDENYICWGQEIQSREDVTDSWKGEGQVSTKYRRK